MEDLHGGACLIDEDERITVLHVPPHLVGYYAAERVKALAHVGRMRVQVETVAVTQAEHPLSGQHDESADGLHRDAPAQTHRDSIGEADLADRLLDGVTAQGRMVLIHEDHLVAAIVDAHRHELAGLSGRHLLTEFSLPMIKTALRNACLLAELTDGCATIHELLVYRSEVIEGPHMLCLFCGQSYRGSVRRQRRGLPNAYRWKASLYSALTKNAIDMMDYNKAREYSKERLSIQITDYLKASQSLTSQGRNNYWDHHYANSLVDASSIDLACGDNGSNAYNAALFQKSILIRQKQSIKDNILQSSDEELRKAFIQYNSEIRSHSISATDTEAYCMYLYSMHPEFVGSFRIPQWHEVQSQLGKNELALEFALANDVETGVAYYVAILLGRSYNAPRIIRLCKKEDFITMATKDRDNTGFSIGLYQDRTVLYHLIWAPIERYLRGVKTIYYSPFEFLNNVSIETASKQSKGKTVGSLYRLIRVSSTAELLPQDNGQYKNAILFGGLDYNASLDNVNTPDRDDTLSDSDNYIQLRGSMGGSWARRPYMKDEVEGIQQLLSGKNISTTLYSAEQGTEEVFKSLSGTAPNILHLATHGFYYTVEEADQYQYFNLIQTPSYNSGVRSGVVLSGANHAWNGERIPQGREDGILTADEISGMDLTGTSILALSACQTALGDIASDGIYGMQRSFKIAGVNTIIMSLWQVDDEATYVMMERFYQELSNGKEKHEAFRIAQTAIQAWAEKRVSELRGELINLPIEVRDKRKAQYGGRLYPEYYWAAFIMLD